MHLQCDAGLEAGLLVAMSDAVGVRTCIGRMVSPYFSHVAPTLNS